MNNSLPLVAIVGQPNAGKSTLMNKIAGKAFAVTSEVAGTTRDRQYIDTAWNGTKFTLVDTAGLAINPKDGLEMLMNEQIDVALDQADIVILVVDGKQPVGAVDQNTIKKFRKIKKPALLCVNKLDSPRTREEKIAEFKQLGIKPSFGVSAVSGSGIGDILDEISKILRTAGFSNEQADEEKIPGAKKEFGIAVSIVGKPNVGKSSIFNAILKEKRVVVSPVPGTTRTAIDSHIKIDGLEYTFIDTAGLKKKEFRQEQPDIFSGFQTFKSIRRSDVCFFVIDASQEITKQDQRVAGEIFAMEKGCIILANKCDLVTEKKVAGTLGKSSKSIAQNQDDKYGSVRDYISHHFPFLWMCPLYFISATTGENLEEAVKAIKPICDSRNKQVDKATLTDFLNKKLKTNPPKLLRDQKKPKVFGLSQIEINPPKFQLQVNHPAAISTQFRKYLENSIIKELGFWGTPITLKLQGKDKA